MFVSFHTFCKMKVFLATLLALSAAVPSMATMPQCDKLVKNPFSDVCGCNEQIYVQNDCRDAFWCSDSTTNQGCSLSCGEDQIVQASQHFTAYD